jgi:acetylornithine/succinyldiaminopimelate/putrescine aminotransferase
VNSTPKAGELAGIAGSAGHGRPGTHLWSFQASGIAPDMVVMGKPMGNDFPVAALVVRSQLLRAVPEEVELFSTFSGNPVACAAPNGPSCAHRTAPMICAPYRTR